MSSRFTLTELAIPDVVYIERHIISDERGDFSRVFCAEELADAGWLWPVAQINQSTTELAGTVRGLHYQNAPYSDAKLVSCLQGRIWDVAVDLRQDSPTFLSWCGHELSAETGGALLVPPGCAHGFQTLTDHVELVYVHHLPFAPEADSGINPLDPTLNIEWPTTVSMISGRDRNLPELQQVFGSKL